MIVIVHNLVFLSLVLKLTCFTTARVFGYKPSRVNPASFIASQVLNHDDDDDDDDEVEEQEEQEEDNDEKCRKAKKKNKKKNVKMMIK